MRPSQREDLLPQDSYEAGPWALNHRYLQESLEERLTEELTDLDGWLSPSESEMHIRLLTVMRFGAIIEAEYPDSVVVPQGSTATASCLPVSDIDLIIFGTLPESQPITVMKSLVKIFHRARMICKGSVLEHASVPLVKLIERPFGFQIDICIGNRNGALNIPRVHSIFSLIPMFRPLLMFMKLFVWAHQIDDPSKGGFGSNQLANLVLFAIQSQPQTTSLGGILLHLLKIFGSRLNFFLAGFSTVNGGRLISKRSLDLLKGQFPHTLICEDPQFHGNFIGKRTFSAIELRNQCAHAHTVLLDYDFTRGSGITAFLPTITKILGRREELTHWAKLLLKPGAKFAYRAERVPTWVSQYQSVSKAQEAPHRHRPYALPAANTEKRQTKTMKRMMKRKKDQEKRAKEKAATLNFSAMWKMAQEEDKKRRQDRLVEVQTTARERMRSPPPFRR
jgi:DNA polymerase sigma